MVLNYTGTGNSEYVAKKIREQIKDEVINLFDKIKGHDYSEIEEIRKHLNNAKPSVYRIRIIHGYHGGTRIRDGIREEFSYGREPKVKRITMGDNQGITEFILREF